MHKRKLKLIHQNEDKENEQEASSSKNHTHDHDHDHGSGLDANVNPNTIQLLYLLSKENVEIKAAYEKLLEQTGHALMHCLELRDPYTYGHSMRVMEYTMMIGRAAGLYGKELKNLELAAMFHDLGKIGIRDCVLLKEAPLSGSEGRIIQDHPVYGADVLCLIDAYKEIVSGVRHHHERPDGRGYPAKLKTDEIPLYSKMILVADTFDAMTTTRPYRKMLPIETAYNELIRYSGVQFDHEFVEIFLKEHQRMMMTGKSSSTAEIKTLPVQKTQKKTKNAA